MTPLFKTIDPEEVFTRGFVSQEEAEREKLSRFSRKVNLLERDGETEGIWLAFLTKEDHDLYNDDASRGEKIRGVLLNDALAWYPRRTWGRVIVGKTNGETRPLFYVEDQIPRFKDTHDAYMREYATEVPSGT